MRRFYTACTELLSIVGELQLVAEDDVITPIDRKTIIKDAEETFTYIPYNKQHYIKKLMKLLNTSKYQTTYSHVEALLRKAIAGYSPIPTDLQKEDTDLQKEDTTSFFANTSVSMSHPEAVYVDTTLAAPVTSAGGDYRPIRSTKGKGPIKTGRAQKPKRDEAAAAYEEAVDEFAEAVVNGEPAVRLKHRMDQVKAASQEDSDAKEALRTAKNANVRRR